MSTGLFGIAHSALLTHQTSLQVVSQNIANAETPGYSRQRPVVSPRDPVRMPNGLIGTGVRFDGIARQRDILLDQPVRSAASLLGESTARRDVLSQVEDIFGEPSDTGLSAALDRFWSAFSDLATSPGSLAAKAVVQQRGGQVARLLNEYDARLTQVRDQATERLATTVGEINQLAEQVAELNGRIVASELGGAVASELRDRRDLLVDELSRKAGVRIEPQPNGSVTVRLVNATLVDGTSARPLRLERDLPTPPPAVLPTDVPVKLLLGNGVDALRPLAGELKALTDVVNTDVPTLRSRLDALAASLVTSVNATHAGGFTFPGGALPGVAAGDFFAPGSPSAPVRASTIALSAAVAADPQAIATSGDASAPLANDIALALSALRNDTTTVNWTGPSGESETAGFNAFFRSTVTRLGIDVRAATEDVTVRSTLLDQAEARRQSVSGVSTDEELIQLMRVQQSYVAATKLIKTADEMLQTLLGLI